MLLFTLLIAISNIFLLASAQCTLTCPAGKTCFAPAAEAMGCLQTIPLNQEWANATLDVLSQSLENFGFDALYHKTGPPYSISLDVQGELANARTMMLVGEFATDLAFQEHVQKVFQRTLDAHTRYQKPVCYAAVFLQPFAFDMRVVQSADPSSVASEPSLFLMRNLYTDQYAAVFPEVDLSSLLDKQVLLLNGVEFTTEISSWSDAYETRSNDPGARFNSAVRSYLYRSAIATNIASLSDLVVTFTDGTQATLPWLASYTSSLADVAVCAAKPKSEADAKALSVSLSRGGPKDVSYPEMITHAPPLKQEILQDERPDREVIVPTTAPYPVTCFVQSVQGEDAEHADVSKVLVMKVSSFSPDGYYMDAWTGFLNQAQTCLSAEFDMIVVDVMQNGGGYVCLGLRLVELLVKDYYEDHKLVQMNYDLPHSDLMAKYIDVVNAPNPYPDPQEVEQILDRSTQESFPDGRAYYYPGRKVTQGGVSSMRTNFFSLDCREAEALPADNWRPPRFVSPDKLVIMTDGTCGSTCASFTKIPQEAGRATFVGVGGIWQEPMDVASFAGGFVCNPDLLANIATWSNTTFPKFLTNQRWQFGWAAWYSAKLPSRPIQFTGQNPDYREAFWGFPHSSIDPAVTTAMVSSLYDRVISSSLSRLAAAATPSSEDCEDSDDNAKTYLLAALITVSVLLALCIALVAYLYFFAWPKRSYSLANADEDTNPLQRGLVAP